MIKTFRDRTTEKIFNGERLKNVSGEIADKARRRMAMLNRAVKLEDLTFPPSNRFHALKGYNPARYSISVNKQWRVTFEWSDGDAYSVAFEDYH